MAVGYSGIIVRTRDAGLTWTSETNSSNKTLESVSMADTVNALALGFFGVLVKRTNQNVSAENINLFENSYFLSHSPSPLNPSTNIKFNIKDEGKAVLSIFDLNGRMVKNLIDGNLSKGIYSIPFTANNLPSGLYSYRLTHQGHTLTKKMIVAK